MGAITRLTLQERNKIEELLKKGLKGSEIARRLGRSKNCVNVEIRINSAESGYVASEAHTKSLMRAREGYERLAEINKGNQYVPKNNERITNLEMQVELLHNCVKELMDKCLKE